jgi:hypothetical protein
MKVTFKDDYVVIRLKLQKPRLSKSGKSMVIATTRGPLLSNATFRGNEVRVVANVIFDAPTPPKPRTD